MIPVTSDSKEITDADVENVVKSALTKSMTPDREVITFIPEEFTVDGFQGISRSTWNDGESDLKCVDFFIQATYHFAQFA